MNSTDLLQDLSLSGEAPTPRRRNREELEQLAAEFVNSRIHIRQPAPRPRPRMPLAVAGGLVAAVLALGAWLWWPDDAPTPVAEASSAVMPGEAPVRRLEAERERQRVQLQQSRDYLARMAAADSALLGEMTARAHGLAARVDEPVAPVARVSPAQTGEPTPKGPAPLAAPEPAPATVTAAAAPPQVPTTDPAAVDAARGEPARGTTAASAPPPVAAASCGIHVSELSASGKLTYADVARMKGARTDAAGHVFTPPVDAGRGRSVVFEVMPSGCVRVARKPAR